MGGEDWGIVGFLVSVIGVFVDEERDKLQVDVKRSPWSVMFNKGEVAIALVLQREITSVMVGGDVTETGVVERGMRVLEITSEESEHSMEVSESKVTSISTGPINSCKEHARNV